MALGSDSISAVGAGRSDREDAKIRSGGLSELWRRPALTIGLTGLLVGAYNFWWVTRHRVQGGFDGDESGYLATAISFRSTLDSDGIWAWLDVARHNYRNGPLVPLLSSLVLQPDDPIATAMLVQQAFHLVAAVAIAATVHRLAGSGPALVAGLVTLGLPGMLVSARSYQLVMGATACLCVAVWALIGSDRGRRTGRLLVFGAAVGAMLVARTMAIAFVPGLGLAALIVVGWSWRSILRLGGAAAVTAIVAAPWWLTEWSNSIYPYLFRYGYGQGAGELGPSSPLARTAIRVGLLVTDVRFPLLLPVLVAGGICIGGLLWEKRPTASRLLEAHPELLALWVIVVVGWTMLLTSSNMGTYFQLPLEVVAIAGLAALPIRSRMWRGLGVAVGALALLNVALLSNVRLGSSVRSGGADLSVAFFGGVEVSQAIDFENGDPRFGPTSTSSSREAAMADWAEAQNLTAEAVARAAPSDGRVVQTFLGDIRLFQITTLAFAEEVTGVARFPWEAPTATSTIGDGTVDLSPRTHDGSTRVLVAVRAETYTPDEGLPADEVLVRAASEGWEVADRVPLPDGGVTEVWVHSSNRTSAAGT